MNVKRKFMDDDEKASARRLERSKAMKNVSDNGCGRKRPKKKESYKSYDSDPANQLLNKSVLEANQISNSDESSDVSAIGNPVTPRLAGKSIQSVSAGGEADAGEISFTFGSQHQDGDPAQARQDGDGL